MKRLIFLSLFAFAVMKIASYDSGEKKELANQLKKLAFEVNILTPPELVDMILTESAIIFFTENPSITLGGFPLDIIVPPDCSDTFKKNQHI